MIHFLTQCVFIGKFYGDFSSAIVKYHSIGGDGIVVEINETKMYQWKYNRGHTVESICFCFVFFASFLFSLILFIRVFFDEMFAWW